MSPREEDMTSVRVLVDRQPADPDGVDGTKDWLLRLCRAAVDALPASGAGVSVMTDQGSYGLAAASDLTSELIEELQFTLGEGPCLEAYATRRPVLTPNLSSDGLIRWPAYAPAAQGHGVGAVFAFPLQIGAARLGVLDVYRAHPGSLRPEALGQALTFAEVALGFLLDRQEAANEAGTEVEGMANIGDALEHRAELYQAQGMVQVQLGVSLADAMARLRAYAYVNDRRLADVAHDVVTRKLTLERDDH